MTGFLIKSDAAITYFDFKDFGRFKPIDQDFNFTFFREFDGIGNQIGDDLFNPCGVAIEPTFGKLPVCHREIELLFGRKGFEQHCGRIEFKAQVKCTFLKCDFSSLNLGEIQNIRQ